MNIPMLDLGQEIENLKPELNAAIERVIASKCFIGGPEVEAFESETATYLGTKHAISCNSGTDALFLSIKAAGIGPGDEVITTPFSFFATAEAVINAGATPVFVDIIPETFNIDPNLIPHAITAKTKAIIPVHLFGHPADMQTIKEIAAQHNLAIFEDCAQAFGAHVKGRKVGSIGTTGCHSFFPSKTLGAFGDGGLISTNDDQLADTLRMLRAHGSKIKYQHEMPGFNSRLDAIQAAVLRVKLKGIDVRNASRRESARIYNELLANCPGVIVPTISAAADHVFHQYTIRITGNRRDALQNHLTKSGIATMVYYPSPIHKSTACGQQSKSLPRSEAASAEVLSLPIWPGISRKVQEQVVDCINGYLGT